MDLLIEHEKYLESGVHIGTRVATRAMKPFIYKYRRDNLCMLNIEQIDQRIRYAVKLLSKYEQQKIAVVASRVYAIPAARKFAEITGVHLITGRFVPGTFTNPAKEGFFEPSLVFVCDPRIERQALIEATRLGIPTIGLVDTDNTTRYIDLFIPCNNKGKRSVPLIFYLLARELQKEKGVVSSNDQFNYSPSNFELSEEDGVRIEGEHEVEEEGEELEEEEGVTEIEKEVEETEEETEEKETKEE